MPCLNLPQMDFCIIIVLTLLILSSSCNSLEDNSTCLKTFDSKSVKYLSKNLQTTIPIKIQAEVFVFFDYANTAKFNGNESNILEYLGIYFQGINNRYATFNDPKISFKVSGIMAVNSRKSQPFLETNFLPGGGYEGSKVLDSFASWIQENNGKLPKHHLAHLITGESLKTRDSSGNYVDTTAGLAYHKGACAIDLKNKRSMGASIAKDVGGIWDGVFTSAHEFAHSLGAVHDGFGSSTSCPWSDGYIMSYGGWGTKNKFYFSNCSIQAIRDFVRSDNAKCLRNSMLSPQNPVTYYGNSGDKLDMTSLCKKYTKNHLAYVDPDKSPSDLCKNLVCRYPDNKGGYYIVSINHPPGDFSPCGNLDFHGKCYNGNCAIWMDIMKDQVLYGK